MAVPTLYHEGLDEWLDLGLAAGAEGGTQFAAQQARSTWRTLVHEQPRDKEPFSVLGVDGEFRHDHGGRARPIEISGMLRGTQTFRAAVLAQRDAWRAAPGVITFTDDDGTEYAQCDLAEFFIGPRARITNYAEFDADASEPCWAFEYRIVLEQLEVES